MGRLFAPVTLSSSRDSPRSSEGSIFRRVSTGRTSRQLVLGSYDPSSGAALSAGDPSARRATINGGSGGALLAYNNGGFEIRALTFVGSGATKNNADGIAFYNDLPGNIVRPHIYLNGVEASGFGRWGIAIGGYNNRSGYADIRITNAASHDNRQGGLVVYGPPFDAVQRNYVNTSVYIASVKAYNNVGDPAATTNTGNGIVLGSVSGAMIERVWPTTMGSIIKHPPRDLLAFGHSIRLR